MTRNTAISVAGLHKRYGENEVLKGVDLEVPEGSVYALLGPNGAGMTLLYPVACYVGFHLSARLGALPLGLNGGEIEHDGLPVFLTGPFSAVLLVWLYVAGSGAFDRPVEPRGAGDPSAERNDASSEVIGQGVG